LHPEKSPEGRLAFEGTTAISQLKSFRALLYEPIHPRAVELLSTVAEIKYANDLEEIALMEAARDVQAIIIRTQGRVSARIIDAAPMLKVVARHGAGVDNIDVQAATARHIYVVNTPEANTESVAEHCVGMMIMLSKHFVPADRALRLGCWQARQAYVGQELYMKTLGIVGFGRIGRRVASICHDAFAMRILYCDVKSYPQEAHTLNAQRTTLEHLLHQSDYVSMHVPLLEETRGLIGRRQFAVMKPTAFIINSSRGEVVDEDALLDALQHQTIAGAGLDVFSGETASADNPLLRLENVVVTPHMAALTEEALLRMGMVVRDVMRVFEGQTPQCWVNRW
jgi:D-3-phosphoglycerate dehydrogenase